MLPTGRPLVGGYPSGSSKPFTKLAAAAARTCANCARVTRHGHSGDAGSEYSAKWYCTQCWQDWARGDRGEHSAANSGKPTERDGEEAMCAQAGCEYLRHSCQRHGYCCNACAAGQDHGLACERRRPGDPTAVRADGRCANRGCVFRRHSSEDHAYCCWACSSCDAHGHDCERKLHSDFSETVHFRLDSVVALGGRCLRGDCRFARHESQGHGFCCLACAQDRAHGSECARRPHIALEDVPVRNLRQLCRERGIDFGQCMAQVEAVNKSSTCCALPRAAPSSDGAALLNENAVLGWADQPQAANPVDSKHTSVPLMTQEELATISVMMEEVERLPSLLRTWGCAVVTGVLSPNELDELERVFQTDLRSLIDEEALEKEPQAVQHAYRCFLEEGPRAFPAASAARLTASAGFVLYRCLMQGQFAWRVRQHANVHRCFAALYPEEEGPLVTSMDVTFFTPEGSLPRNYNRFSAHVDQNLHDVREGLSACSSYQGALYVWSADGASSTTALWPGSHKDPYSTLMNDTAFKDSGRCGMHYCEISSMRDKDKARSLAAGWAAGARRVPVPAGALLIWTSRLVHCGWTGGPRLAQAVCLQPASRRSEVQRIAKLRLAALGLPSAHWASIAMQHDMVLGDGGYFSRPMRYSAKLANGLEEEEDLQVAHDDVVLPMKAAVRPSALAENADLIRLRRLVKVPYKYIGMWVPPSSTVKLLEASVTDECKALV